MINLSPFGPPSESKGYICEAPRAATLRWSLDRTGGKTDTFEEGEKEAGQGDCLPPDHHPSR